MAKRSMFVGMDVHKESIDVSLAEEGRDGEVRHDGVIPGDLAAVATLVRALRARTRRLRFVYEAGPCGFGLEERAQVLADLTSDERKLVIDSIARLFGAAAAGVSTDGGCCVRN